MYAACSVRGPMQLFIFSVMFINYRRARAANTIQWIYHVLCFSLCRAWESHGVNFCSPAIDPPAYYMCIIVLVATQCFLLCCVIGAFLIGHGLLVSYDSNTM